jgi:hypothetical protein
VQGARSHHGSVLRGRQHSQPAATPR